MTRDLRIEYPGAFYHITSRGNEKKPIYSDDKDKEIFLKYLESAYTRFKSIFHLYCLMDNHYHLVLETPLGNLSKIMHFINASYATYFNKKHARCGHLLQRRYKAILVQEDRYMMELSRYIHLNPVRAGITKTPAYPWSSYNAYSGKGTAPPWLNTDLILSQTSETNSQTKYKAYVAEADNSKIDNPLHKSEYGLILGTEEFVRNVKRIFVEGLDENRDLPVIHHILDNTYDINHIVKCSEKILTDVDDAVKRSVSIYVAHKYSGLSLREIGEYFSISESGVSQASRRVSKKMADSTPLHRSIEHIIDLLNKCV